MPKTMTIFTPTFNRGYIIENLYKSLLTQTNKDFCWLVVDDGSTDNTKEIIYKLIKENKIEITYLYQKNGGKQRAHNTGVSACVTELFFCVDSDDMLVPTAVQDVLELWHTCHDNQKIAGIVAMRGSSENKPIGTVLPRGLKHTTTWDLYYKLHHRGDIALIYRTQILKKYPYVVEEGEKFISEFYVYHQIDQAYELEVLNKIIWICKYLPDGYTAHVRQITRDNPRSYMRHKLLLFSYSDTARLKLENATLYFVGAFLAHRFKQAYADFPGKFLRVVCAPVALLLGKTVYNARQS